MVLFLSLLLDLPLNKLPSLNWDPLLHEPRSRQTRRKGHEAEDAICPRNT